MEGADVCGVIVRFPKACGEVAGFPPRAGAVAEIGVVVFAGRGVHGVYRDLERRQS